MKYFEIIDNKVVSQAFTPQPGWVEGPNDVWPGYIRQPDGSFKAPPEPEPALEPLKPVTRKQLIDVLIDHDLDEKVEPALNAISDDKARKKALNAWQNASQYEPDHPLVLQLKGALKLKDEQFDAFWREAMAS